MIKLYLSCILVALSSSLTAQTLTTQFQNFEWDGALFDWVLRTAESYQYDERDSVRVVDNRNNWFGPLRSIISKDESGNIVESLSLSLDSNNVWQPIYRISYTRPAENTEIILEESFVNGGWKGQNLSTVITQTTAAGNEREQTVQNFENGVWINRSRYFTLRNEADILLKEIQYAWEDDDWVMSLRREDIYNEQGDQVYYENRNFSSGYFYRVRWAYTYNAAMQPLTVRREQATDDPPTWNLITVDSFEYDGLDRQIRLLRTWPTVNKVRLEETEYRGDTIVRSAKQAFNNAPLEGLYRRWVVEGPRENGLSAFSRSDNWINGAWVSQRIERRSFSFDQYDNLIRIDQEKLVDTKWHDQFYYSYNWQYREDGKPLKMVSLSYNYTTQQQTPFEKRVWRYEDQNKKSDRPIIEIAPNPSTGPLNIVFHTADALPIRWQLLDETGRIVRTAEISVADNTFGMELYIEDLPFGLYILQIKYEDGRTVSKKWQKI